MMEQFQTAIIGYFTNLRTDNTPTFEDFTCLRFILRLNNEQHSFLGFRQHHFVSGHSIFTLWNLIEIQFQTITCFTCHLSTGAS